MIPLMQLWHELVSFLFRWTVACLGEWMLGDTNLLAISECGVHDTGAVRGELPNGVFAAFVLVFGQPSRRFEVW